METRAGAGGLVSTLEQVLAATRWTVGGRSGGDLLPWSRLNTTIRALCHAVSCHAQKVFRDRRTRANAGRFQDRYIRHRGTDGSLSVGTRTEERDWTEWRWPLCPRFLNQWGVVMTVKGAPSELLAAFVIDCRCGERLLLGDAFGVIGTEETAAWCATLDDVARRLAVPLVWGRDQESCPRCGAQVSRVSSARR